MKSNIRPIDIAKRLNVSTSTLRSYETRGIIPPTERLDTGYRIYTEEHLAYFECIVAMSPGFGMEITTAVLKKLQQKNLNSALWIINEIQAVTYQEKELATRIIKDLNNIVDSQSIANHLMTIGEVANKTKISTSTIRYWEKERHVNSKRGKNNYRYFNSYQFIKILLMKLTQNAVYSHEIVQLKKSIRNLEEYNIEGAKSIVRECQQHLNKRNQEQLHGLYFLYQLCAKLGLK
ncbi:DNA-binding transcriptional regulator, MerR family [Bacillus sp. 491mf]|uniref:MerR family transcriptional regulator n=1 Tax=Bacillus sp. 491mf TaxID=1761755 RepID=UPI0008E402ED|nr:MerR family DNA-binding transcriptional regulator [Bacillus sp. 491mf]SFC72853.1 DNA-binding transcriptional regulator, MerR family [Bacillus sp. 491mf]